MDIEGLTIAQPSRGARMSKGLAASDRVLTFAQRAKPEGMVAGDPLCMESAYLLIARYCAGDGARERGNCPAGI